jgi:hypothetical protein
VPGFSNLSTAAQFEVEYLLPLVYRVFDVRQECARLNRADPGRIPDWILSELGAIERLGAERLDGQKDRAEAATPSLASRSGSVDQCLQLMLDLRDQRMDAGKFSGTYGVRRRQYDEMLQKAEISLRVKSDAWSKYGWGGGGGGRGGRNWPKDPWKEDPQQAGAPAPAQATAKGGKGKNGRGGKGKGRGGRA